MPPPLTVDFWMPFYPVRSAGFGASLSSSEKLEQRGNLRLKNRLLKPQSTEDMSVAVC